MFWYQIHPNYYEQFLKEKNIVANPQKNSFYTNVSKSLKYIKNLGCEGVWLMPLFIRGDADQDGNASPYAIKDFALDPKWGSKFELWMIITRAHLMGMKVMTEYIPNHVSKNNTFILANPDAAFHDENNNFLYDSGWGDTIKLDHANPKTINYTSKNINDLLYKYKFDGLRLDMCHYCFYDINKSGEYKIQNLDFWKNVLNPLNLNRQKKYLVGEVYDDRNKEYDGYGDPIRVINSNIDVYDKKIYDIFSSRLKSNDQSFNFQNKFYTELILQKNAVSIAHSSSNILYPFLRFTSNHDDNPGINNFGGISEYLLTFSILALLPGEHMIYNGDEFGLKYKPSVVGTIYKDQTGNITDINKIELIDSTNQVVINNFITTLLKLRLQNDVLKTGDVLIPKIVTENSNMSNVVNNGSYNIESNNFIGICKYITGSTKIYILIANLSKDKNEIWAEIKEFYPDINSGKIFTIKELIQLNLKSTNSYKVRDLLSNHDDGVRDFNAPFFVGLKGLEVQLLEITANVNSI